MFTAFLSTRNKTTMLALFLPATIHTPSSAFIILQYVLYSGSFHKEVFVMYRVSLNRKQFVVYFAAFPLLGRVRRTEYTQFTHRVAMATFLCTLHQDGKNKIRASEGEGCTPTSFYQIYHHVQSCGGQRSSWEGQIHSPYFSSTSICTLWFAKKTYLSTIGLASPCTAFTPTGNTHSLSTASSFPVTICHIHTSSLLISVGRAQHYSLLHLYAMFSISLYWEQYAMFNCTSLFSDVNFMPNDTFPFLAQYTWNTYSVLVYWNSFLALVILLWTVGKAITFTKTIRHVLHYFILKRAHNVQPYSFLWDSIPLH